MYVNKCTKCGAEFETKNPKRVICPDCLYPDKKESGNDSSGNGSQDGRQQSQDGNGYERTNSYSSGGYSSDAYPRRDDRPRYDDQRGYSQGGYQRQQGGYDRQRSSRPYDRNEGYQRPQQGGYQRQQGGYNRPQQGGYQRPQGGYNRPQGGGFNRQGGRPQQTGFRPQQGRRPMGGARPQRPPKQLLVNKEQLILIEELYKKMLPLPNPDAHEVIGEQIGLEARKVFFGINLVRQKMMLPKLAFPKRKLAVSPDQLTAIKMLYEPLLPLPPIGCHKIISAQLKIDEWRVHVGIGLLRKQMGLDRWNPEREDAPAEFKVSAKPSDDSVSGEDAPVKKTRGRKKTVEPVNEDE